MNECDLKAQATIFKTMANADISVDFINISPTNVIYTVPTEVAEEAVSLLEKQGFNVKVKKNCAKVSAVGAGMTGIPGVAAKIAEALVTNDVQILQSADSHTTIWVFIDDKHLKTAINALHEAFELSKITDKGKETVS